MTGVSAVEGSTSRQGWPTAAKGAGEDSDGGWGRRAGEDLPDVEYCKRGLLRQGKPEQEREQKRAQEKGPMLAYRK